MFDAMTRDRLARIASALALAAAYAFIIWGSWRGVNAVLLVASIVPVHFLIRPRPEAPAQRADVVSLEAARVRERAVSTRSRAA